MGLSVVHNSAASIASRYLDISDRNVTRATTRLAAGTRVVSARDDAASMAIGSRLNVEVNGLRQSGENARQAIELLLAPDQWNRPYVAPPGVPPERVKLLRDGFEAMARSPAMVEEMTRQRLELELMTGAEMTRRILAMEQMSVEVIQTAIAAIKPK